MVRVVQYSKSFVALLVFVATSMFASAQTPAWSSTPVGAGGVVGMEQSYVFVREGQVVKAFSSLTKTWASVTCVFGAPITYNYNEHLLVKDGPMFHAFSPRTAMFSSQFVANPGATLVPPTGPQTWHSAVVDGNVVHVYLALHGTWIPVPTTGVPTVTVGRLCLLIGDATGMRAMSSYYGSAVPCPDPGVSVLGAFGATAAVINASAALPVVWAYSAHLNVWRAQPVVSTPTAISNGLISGIVAIRDALSVHFFSSHTATFASVPVTSNASVFVNRQVGLVVDGPTATAFSGILGTTVSTSVSGTVSVDAKDFFSIVNDASGRRCFSGPTGQWSSVMPGAFNVLSGGSHQAVCLLVDASTSTPSYVYSSILNQWVPVPPIPGSTPYVRSDLAAIQDPAGGLWAMSATDPTWVFQSAPPGCTVTLGTSSFVARNGTQLYAFNPRAVAWRSFAAATPIVGSAQHMCAAVLWDATTLYGWSTFADRWETTPLSGSVVQSNAEIYNGWVRTVDTLHTFGGAGELLTTTDFPDYVRVATAGSPFRLDLAGSPGASALVVASPARADMMTPWGRLQIDPNFAALLAAPAVPSGGTWGMTLLVPPGLSGTTVFFQAVLFGTSGPVLTNSAQVRLY